MPSAISLKKLTASSWSAGNESDNAPAEADTAHTDKAKQDTKHKKKGGLSSRVDVETILNAKRKRTVPADEQHLSDWLKANFESKEDGYLTGGKMYGFYEEFCALEDLNLPDKTYFNRQLNNVLGGKKFLIKEGSTYKGLVSEKTKDDKNKEKKPAKKTESMNSKLKDIIIEALTEGKSPKKGLRFQWIKNYIISKYPALRIDLRQHLLNSVLERAVKYGLVELVRGIGMVGYYRLPGEYPDDEEDEKKKKSKKRPKKAKTEGQKEGENGEKEGGEPKEGEEKKANGKDEEGEGEKSSPKAKKKRSSKKKARRRPMYETISPHVEPRTIDDTFPMAMTFMCEPKEASANKIKKYIQKYFPSVDLETNFKKTLLNGCEKGLWDQVTGTGSAGRFSLQVDDINPLDCTSLEDMICLAILACHEPKQTSVNLLKQYIIEYHPDFNIDKRPHLFKMALERAQKKGNIIRLTGIGSTGSFQLSDPFTPSPNWLGGEDDSDVGEVIEDILAEPLQAYKARPSKRRGMGRAAAASGRQPDFISYAPSVKSKPKKRKRKPSYKDEEESEEEEVEQKPSRSRSRKPVKKTSRKRAAPVESDDDQEADDADDDEPAEYTPRKTASRGGTKPSAAKGKPQKKSSAKSGNKGRSKTASKKEVKRDKKQSKSNQRKSKRDREEEVEEEEAEDEVSDGEIVEKKSKPKKQKRSESKSPRKSASRSPSKNKSRHARSEDSEDEGELQSRSARKKSRVSYAEEKVYSESDEEEGEVPERSRKRWYDEEAEDSLSEQEEVPTKSKSKPSPRKRAALESGSEDDEDVGSKRKRTADPDTSDDEAPPKSTKSPKKSQKKSKKRR